jgi:hypothetical protein
VLALNAPLRAAVIALVRPDGDEAMPAVAAPALGAAPAQPTKKTEEQPHRKAARYTLALLLARVYEVFTLLCPKCGGEMRVIAFNTEPLVICDILDHLGVPTTSPRLMPARGLPLWDWLNLASGQFDPQAQPASDYEFDQRVAW